VIQASSSLGYGFFIVGFWVIAAIVLMTFLRSSFIRPKSILQKIGVFTATPILSIVGVFAILSFKENEGSEWYFSKGNFRYKVKTFNHKEPTKIKRIEYYRSADVLRANGLAEKWVKDSTWIYFSESGDTIKRVCYRNDIEVK
jgi:hypothetical protein